MKPENTVILKFKRLLHKKHKNYWFYKIPDAFGIGGNRPFDALLIIKGKLFAIEFKVGSGKPTKYQAACLRKVAKAGGHPLCVNHANVDRIFREGEL